MRFHLTSPILTLMRQFSTTLDSCNAILYNFNIRHAVPALKRPVCASRQLAASSYTNPPRKADVSIRPFPISRLTTSTMTSKDQEPVKNGATTPKQVFFFDIDNCLYPKSAKVHDLMADLIDTYFEKHLNLPRAEAVRLHKEYYTNYGLAIEGLVRHHQIDPLEYNAKVDDALPLDGVIKPRPELKKLLEDIDRSNIRLWLFTNAYVNHAHRVIRLLGIEDMFEGVTYCDYAKVPFVCKPQKDAYVKAMKEAGVEKWEDCFFVDDNYGNCVKAQEFGWNTAHLVEDDVPLPKTQASKYQIRHLEDLRTVFPQFFKKA